MEVRSRVEQISLYNVGRNAIGANRPFLDGNFLGPFQRRLLVFLWLASVVNHRLRAHASFRSFIFELRGVGRCEELELYGAIALSPSTRRICSHPRVSRYKLICIDSVNATLPYRSNVPLTALVVVEAMQVKMRWVNGTAECQNARWSPQLRIPPEILQRKLCTITCILSSSAEAGLRYDVMMRPMQVLTGLQGWHAPLSYSSS